MGGGEWEGKKRIGKVNHLEERVWPSRHESIECVPRESPFGTPELDSRRTQEHSDDDPESGQGWNIGWSLDSHRWLQAMEGMVRTRTMGWCDLLVGE
jgi:hypothetical protein